MEMEQGTVVIRLQRSKQRSVGERRSIVPSLVGTLLSASVVKRLDDDDESSTTTTAEEHMSGLLVVHTYVPCKEIKQLT